VLKGLEDDLLYRLANSTGNLLDDVELIEVLQMSKSTAVEVNEKLTIAVDTDIRINTAREEYRPAARRGALLYFLIVDMAAINNMYMVSLQQFLELHDYSVNNSDKAPIAAKRIVNIIDYMTNYVTRYMHRGLFERHKKIWTLMLTMKIEQVADRLSAAYVGNLLKGGGALDAKSEKPAPASWIPEAVWLNVLALSRTVQMLRDLPDNLERYNDGWRAWYDHDAPETQPFPDYNERLDKFEQMLLVRAIREDRALLAVDTYIAHTIGRDYLIVKPLDLMALHDEASCYVPMITLLSTGSDPTGKIQDLCRKKKNNVLSISMGQGQEPAARKLLDQGIAEGIWVLLQNCHLGLSFMGECQEWVASLPKLEESAPGSVAPPSGCGSLPSRTHSSLWASCSSPSSLQTRRRPASWPVSRTRIAGSTRTSSIRSPTPSGRRCSLRSPSCIPSCRSDASSARLDSTFCTSSRRPTSRRA